MSHNITIPFFAFKLRLVAGGNAMVPMRDADALHLNTPLYLLAGKYAESFQQKVLNKGDYLKILDEFSDGDFLKAAVEVSFPAAKNKIAYPAFSLIFDYYYQKTKKGIWGIVPTLNVEAFGDDELTLEARLQEAIRLEFARKKRLSAVQEIVSALWFDTVELQREDMDLKVLTLSELDNINEEEKEELLSNVAKKLSVDRQVLYGRKAELNQLERALKGSFNRNVLLVGASGVGKTALIWEMARQQDKRAIRGHFWETTASTLIKELTTDMGWQENLAALCRDLAAREDFLFVRNLLELFEVGQYEGNSASMADYMRAYISSGEVNMISECTPEEYAKIELRSSNFLSLFQIIRLEEPEKDLEEIIVKKVGDIAKIRSLNLEPEAIKETIRLNRRFTPYSGFPGKPIRFLESILINHKKENQSLISRSDVIQYFCEETGMPSFMVDPNIPIDPAAIKKEFNQNIFGQVAAVDKVVDLLASVKTALTKRGKPIASYLFVGPTGVGKTEMAKVLSSFMFSSRERMLRFDMSEYSNPASVMRLIGTSYYSDGLLTSAVRRDPFSVLLFDEIEKADPTFYDLLLQVLDEGRLTDSSGKLVNFCSTIIIMTSNIGAANMQGNRIGWKTEMDTSAVNSHFMTAVQKHFRPELYNRIDQVIPFSPLSKETIRFVVDREIGLFKKREGVKYRKMEFRLNDDVLNYLGEKGYDPKYGARQLQRTIREEIVIPLARQFNLYENDDQLIVELSVAKDTIAINIEADPLGLDLLMEELEKITNTDHASELRRKIYKLKDGPYYIRLLSELDIMEREKRKQGERFWKDKEKGEQYSYFLDTQQKVEKLSSLIETIEMDLSLSCMDLKPYTPKLIESVEEWKKDFFDLKLEIYTRRNPAAKKCSLLIFGKNIKLLYQFYTAIFKAKSFAFNASSIWYREAYYNEIIEAVELVEEEGEMIQQAVNRPREEYIEQEFGTNEKKGFKPEEQGDQLYGIRFELVGDCPFLYLLGEDGIQNWKLSDKESYTYIVQLGEQKLPIPDGIHRPTFYPKKNIRRQITLNHIRDSALKLNRELGKGRFSDLVLEVLNKVFELKLDAELL